MIATFRKSLFKELFCRARYIYIQIPNLKSCWKLNLFRIMTSDPTIN
jgi:hypothetical protein